MPIADCRLPTPDRRRLRRLGLVVGSAALALLIAELAVRLFTDTTDVVRYVSHETVGRLAEANQTGVFRRDFDDPIRAAFRFNAAGFNSPHEFAPARTRGMRRLLILGDSFVEALQVDADESCARRAETALGPAWQVYPLGVSGLGTVDELALLRDVADAYERDAVVLLFCDNDLADSADDADRPRVDDSLAARLVRGSALLRRIYFQKGLYRRHRSDRSQRQSQVWLQPAPEWVEPAWSRVETALDTMNRHCRNAGVALVVLRVPPEQSMSYAEAADPDANHGAVGLRLARLCSERSIPFTDLRSDLETDHRLTGRRHYHRGDGHWNAAGHEVAGRRIAEMIRRQVPVERVPAERFPPPARLTAS